MILNFELEIRYFTKVVPVTMRKKLKFQLEIRNQSILRIFSFFWLVEY